MTTTSPRTAPVEHTGTPVENPVEYLDARLVPPLVPAQGRMPRSLQPLPGESLSGYILNLAHRLETTPGDLALRLGMINPTTTYSTLNTQYAVALPPDITHTIATATGLTHHQVTDLTHTPHQRLFLDADQPPTSGWSPQMLYVEHWIAPTTTGWCPHCLAQPHADNPDRRLWQRDWASPWLLACTRHTTVLTTTCPNHQAHAPLKRDPQAQSLIRAPRHLVPHPTGCRRPLTSGSRAANVTLCHAPLERATHIPAAPETLALQHRLNALLAGDPTPTHTIGIPVTPTQYLRDLRITAVLIQIARDHTVLTGLPADHTASTRHYLDAGRTRASTRDTTPDPSGLHHKTWARPIPDPVVAATVITAAARLLDNPDADADDRLMDLVEQAMTNEPARWKKLRWHARPSPSLAPLLSPERKGIISLPNLRRTSQGHRPNLNPDHVPAYLDTDTYQRIAATIGTHEERALRRTVPLGVVRHHTQSSLADAARHLGYTQPLAAGATGRLGTLATPTDIETIRQATIDYAHHLSDTENPTNYAARRAHFDPDWTIPEPLWDDLTHQLRIHRITNKPSVLNERRPAYDIWIWAIVTSGDPLAAPMLDTNASRPTGQRLSTTQNLWLLQSGRIKAQPLHEQLVHDLAAHIAAHIDGQT